MFEKEKDWLRKFIDYKKLPALIEQESGRGSYKESLILALISEAVTFVSTLAKILISLLFAATPVPPEQLLALVAILSFISLVSFYVMGLTAYLVGMLLGGKGTPGNLLYLLSVVKLCVAVVSVPIVILSAFELVIPFILALLFSFAALAVFVYSLYAIFIAVRHALSISSIRTLAVLLGTLLIGALVLAIFGLSAGTL